MSITHSINFALKLKDLFQMKNQIQLISDSFFDG
jgi:hypothetical protein